MEKLWSPWRTEYIDSFKNSNKKEGCIFCELEKEKVDDQKSLLIDKGALTFTVLNLYPYNNGHLMIVPYRHTSEFTSLNNEESIECMEKLQLALKALKSAFKPDGFNVGLNLGKVSGAGIHEHIHFHIVPRWNGDTNFMPVLGKAKVISQDLLITKKKILASYGKLNSVKL
jgi:ATP adenylyltransferase